MSKLANALTEEIRRLARREAKAMVAPLRTAVRQLRDDIRRLNRQESALGLHLSQTAPRSAALAGPAPETAAKARLSPGLIGKLRARLGLTLSEFAALVDASSGSVFNWEHGKSKPTPALRARLIATRQLGRREARRLVKAALETKTAPAT